MKIAVSIPDEIFQQADEVAERLGLTRSRLYTDALRRYLWEQSADSVTERLNAVYSEERSEIDPELIQMQVEALTPEDWTEN